MSRFFTKTALIFFPLMKFQFYDSFPGGALFLFEVANEKSIIHAGDLRLHSEITENEFLTKTNVDEVRFDRS